MTKNPALNVLIVVGVVAAVAAIALFAAAAAGLGRTYDFASMDMVGGVQWWFGVIPAGIAVLAAIGALVLWGLGRQPR